MQLARIVTELAISVGAAAATFALTILSVFWFIPLAVISAMFGATFRNILASVVSPASRKGGRGGDDGEDDPS